MVDPDQCFTAHSQPRKTGTQWRLKRHPEGKMPELGSEGVGGVNRLSQRWREVSGRGEAAVKLIGRLCGTEVSGA